MERILSIDDDVELCHLVSEYLRSEGFTTRNVVHDGESGLKKASVGEQAFWLFSMLCCRGLMDSKCYVGYGLRPDFRCYC